MDTDAQRELQDFLRAQAHPKEQLKSMGEIGRDALVRIAVVNGEKKLRIIGAKILQKDPIFNEVTAYCGPGSREFPFDYPCLVVAD